VLMPAMDQAALREIQHIEATGDTQNPRYMELLLPNHYEQHLLRIPAAQWPDPVQRTLKHLNPNVYVPMQGPSELGASGKLVDWDRSKDLGKITVPTLVVGARYDTMDPKHMEWMASQMPHARYLYCPNGSHMALYDDQQTWFGGVIGFIRDVDGGKF
jgi:proline iminopeptidase